MATTVIWTQTEFECAGASKYQNLWAKEAHYSSHLNLVASLVTQFPVQIFQILKLSSMSEKENTLQLHLGGKSCYLVVKQLSHTQILYYYLHHLDVPMRLSKLMCSSITAYNEMLH